MQALLFLILLALVITYWYVFAGIIVAVLAVWIIGKTTVALYRGVAANPARFGMAKPESNHLHWKAGGHSTAAKPLGKLNDPPMHSVARAVTPSPPELFWPLAALLWTGGWAVFWLVLGIVSLEPTLAVWFVVSVLTFLPSQAWYRRRVVAREAWRQERRVAWFFKPPLKGPEVTDWEAWERDLNPEWS